MLEGKTYVRCTHDDEDDETDDRGSRYMGARITAVLLMAAILGPTAGVRAQDGEGYWPQWRGPSGTGSVAGGGPRIQWSDRQNVRWTWL